MLVSFAEKKESLDTSLQFHHLMYREKRSRDRVGLYSEGAAGEAWSMCVLEDNTTLTLVDVMTTLQLLAESVTLPLYTLSEISFPQG